MSNIQNAYCDIRKRLQALTLIELFHLLGIILYKVDCKITQKIIAAIGEVSQNIIEQLY